MFIVKFCLFALLLHAHVQPFAHAFCSEESIIVGVLELPPYVTDANFTGLDDGIISKYFSESIHECFENPPPEIIIKVTKTPGDLFYWLQDAEVDFAFPVTDANKEDMEYENVTTKLTYFDVMFSPGYAIISDIDLYNSQARSMVILLLLKEWPIFAFTFLLAGIAGVFIWAAESRVNRDEFPGSFIRGWYEGMWWAVVTMTTVGYGDKSPRTLCGRLFAILWVFVGLVLISILTAVASSALGMTSGANNALNGMKVAVPDDYTTEEKADDIGMVTINMSNFDEMYSALQGDRVEGIFIDVYQARYHMTITTQDDQLRIFRQIESRINYKIASTVSNTCPIMNQCFRKKLEHPSVQSLKHKFIPSGKLFNPAKDAESLFSGDSRSTRRVLFILSGTFAALMLLGAAGERAYKCFSRQKKSSADGVGGGNRVFALASPSLAKQLHEIEESLGNLTWQLQQVKEQLAAARHSGGHALTNESSSSITQNVRT